jgi:hypothetical protein
MFALCVSVRVRVHMRVCVFVLSRPNLGCCVTVNKCGSMDTTYSKTAVHSVLYLLFLAHSYRNC